MYVRVFIMPTTASIAGHTDSVLSCVVQPGGKLLASGGEDGALCLTDLSSLQHVGRIQQGLGEAVPALVWHPAAGEQHSLYAAAGSAVLQLDLRQGLNASAVVQSLAASTEEINCLAGSAANGGWLAAGDDGGEVQLISLQHRHSQAQQQDSQQPPLQHQKKGERAGIHDAQPADAAILQPVRPASYRTLRRGHANICAAVAFRPHRPWELLSGALDATVVRWDFSRLRPLHSWSLSGEAATGGGQLFNPPMVHSLAVPPSDDRQLCRMVAVARGDGCISLYDADATSKPATGTSGSTKGGKKGRQNPPQASGHAPVAALSGLLARLGGDQGGHTAAVNCVAFTPASGCQRLLSAGNDRRLLLWNWPLAVRQTSEAGKDPSGNSDGIECQTSSSIEQGGPAAQQQHQHQQLRDGQQHTVADTGAAGGGPALLAAEYKHGRKINWVCPIDVPGCPYDTIIADTGRRLTALALC